MPSSPLATTTGRSSTPCSYCSAMAMWVGLVTTTFDPLPAESLFCCDHPWCNCLRRDLLYGSPSFSLPSRRIHRRLMRRCLVSDDFWYQAPRPAPPNKQNTDPPPLLPPPYPTHPTPPTP